MVYSGDTEEVQVFT